MSGGITKVWVLMADDVQQFADRNIRDELPTAVLIPSSLGDNPTLMGALSLVFRTEICVGNLDPKYA